MRGQPGFFDVEERLKELSAKGDALERLNAVVDFELFRADLERAVSRSDGSKGGRPAFDHVLMFKVLVLQASHDARRSTARNRRANRCPDALPAPMAANPPSAQRSSTSLPARRGQWAS